MKGYLYCVTKRGLQTVAMVVDAEFWARYKDRPDCQLSDQIGNDLTEGFEEIENGVFRYAGLPLEASEMLQYAGARNAPEIATAWGFDPNDSAIQLWNSRHRRRSYRH